MFMVCFDSFLARVQIVLAKLNFGFSYRPVEGVVGSPSHMAADENDSSINSYLFSYSTRIRRRRAGEGAERRHKQTNGSRKSKFRYRQNLTLTYGYERLDKRRKGRRKRRHSTA